MCLRLGQIHSTKVNVCMKSLQELSLFKNNHVRWLANLPSIRKKHTHVSKWDRHLPHHFEGWTTKIQRNKSTWNCYTPNQLGTPFLAILDSQWDLYRNWWIIPKGRLPTRQNSVFLLDLRFDSMLAKNNQEYSPKLGVNTGDVHPMESQSANKITKEESKFFGKMHLVVVTRVDWNPRQPKHCLTSYESDAIAVAHPELIMTTRLLDGWDTLMVSGWGIRSLISSRFVANESL